MAVETVAETVGTSYTSSFFSTPLLAIAIAIAAAIWLCSSHNSKSSEDLPTWIPLEIGLSTALLKSHGVASYLPFLLRRSKGSLFGLSSRHQMLGSLPGVDKLLAKGHHVDSNPLGLSLSIRVFGATDTPRLRQTFAEMNKRLVMLVERGFVNDAATTASIQRGNIPQKMATLLSFSEEPRDQQHWERAASVRIIAPEAVELNLDALLRDFGACVSVPLLYGQDFLDRNPTLLEDFWKFDNDAFPFLIAGLPSWIPLKSFQNGLAARSRLQNALDAFYHRVDQFQNNQVVDFDADMSDVSITALARNKVFKQYNLSTAGRGQLELGTFWGQNANTQPLVFWFILYIYSTPGLLDALRREVETCMTLSASSEPPRITEMDTLALGRDCPLLKSALFETFRMANEATSIRYVSRSLTVADGEHQHDLRAGTWISAAHAVIQSDPSVFPDPHRFVPDRFLEVDQQTGQKAAHYGKLKPWGVGIGICKGRTFAEKHILAVVSCFITLWEMEPCGGGPWKVPGSIPGTGVLVPKEAVRVVLKRRSFH